jgi:hypothetical protein
VAETITQREVGARYEQIAKAFNQEEDCPHFVLYWQNEKVCFSVAKKKDQA